MTNAAGGNGTRSPCRCGKSDLFWSRFLLGVIAIALGAAVQTLAALLSGQGELLSSLAVTAPSAVVYLLITLPLMMKLAWKRVGFFFCC